MEAFPLNVEREFQGKILFLVLDLVPIVELYDGPMFRESADSWINRLAAYNTSNYQTCRRLETARTKNANKARQHLT